MFRLFQTLTILTLFLSGPVIGAQDGEFHEFTDKKGQSILAILLDVSADKRLMKIRREDGQTFETEINVLSLDDQQFIKDWLKTRTVRTDFRLELSIQRKAQETERHNLGSGTSFTVERRFSTFDITLRNLSRETLAEARLEYLIAWNEELSVHQISDGQWTYSSPRNGGESRTKIAGEAELESLAYNRDTTITTEPFEINRLQYSSTVEQEDQFLGIIVRVVASDGSVITESRSGGASIDRLEWETVAAFSDPAERN